MKDLLHQCVIQSAEGWTGHRWVPQDELDRVITLPSPTGPREYRVIVAWEPALHEDTFKAQHK